MEKEYFIGRFGLIKGQGDYKHECVLNVRILNPPDRNIFVVLPIGSEPTALMTGQ